LFDAAAVESRPALVEGAKPWSSGETLI